MNRRGLVIGLAAPFVAVLTGFMAGPVAAAIPHAWAVGTYFDGSQEQMLIEQWNGTTWAVQTTPAIAGSVNNLLNGTAATSSGNAWAVGQYYTGTVWRNLIVNWNGISWTQQAAPNKGSDFNWLNAVAATSSSSAWAVGVFYDATHTEKTLIMHWNGSSWSIQASPSPGSDFNVLTSVTAISDSNVWALGFYGNGGHDRNLALHWNGSKWSMQTLPIKGTNSDNDLLAVDSSSAQNVWAVGSVYNYNNLSRQTLALHRTSSGWHVVTTPNVNATDDELKGVAVITAKNAWAVGAWQTASTGGIHLMHWNGSSWATRSVPVSQPGKGRAILALSASSIWFVGNYNPSGHARTLVVHFNGTKWKVQPSDNASTYDNALVAIAAVP